jgi:hypothetical protein
MRPGEFFKNVFTKDIIQTQTHQKEKHKQAKQKQVLGGKAVLIQKKMSLYLDTYFYRCFLILCLSMESLAFWLKSKN